MSEPESMRYCIYDSKSLTNNRGESFVETITALVAPHSSFPIVMSNCFYNACNLVCTLSLDHRKYGDTYIHREKVEHVHEKGYDDDDNHAAVYNTVRVNDPMLSEYENDHFHQVE